MHIMNVFVYLCINNYPTKNKKRYEQTKEIHPARE